MQLIIRRDLIELWIIHLFTERSRDEFQIFVSLWTGEHKLIDANRSDNIEKIKCKIQNIVGIPKIRQRIVFAGEELNDECVLLDIPDLSVFDLKLRLLGGLEIVAHVGGNVSHTIDISQNATISEVVQVATEQFQMDAAHLMAFQLPSRIINIVEIEIFHTLPFINNNHVYYVDLRTVDGTFNFAQQFLRRRSINIGAGMEMLPSRILYVIAFVLAVFACVCFGFSIFEPLQYPDALKVCIGLLITAIFFFIGGYVMDHWMKCCQSPLFEIRIPY